MSQHYPWWPKTKADQIVWLYNCMAVWPAIGPTLGFTPAQVTAFSLVLTETVTVMTETDQCQVAMKAVNDWRETVIYGPETDKIAPASPTITTPATPTINGGFFSQIKRWRGQVMSSADYTNAIGEALGFVGPEKQSLNPEVAQPDFKVVTETDYWVNFKGSMQGFDAVRVEYQRKGVQTWENLGFLTKTPGGLQITPAVPDSAEMGMVRCVFVNKNENVGNYSPNYPVTIS
ncbi:MAG: hypothetical protein AB7J13_10975 [Pyrinomonadaceae bacterium]